MNKTYALVFPFLSIASVTYSMDNNNNSFDFKKDVICLDGKRLTRENILTVLEPAPADAVHALAQFDAQHPNLLKQSAKFDPLTATTDFKAVQTRLQNEHIVNTSRSSLITQLNAKYILKMSLHPHKLFILSGRKNGIGNGWNRCAETYANGQNLPELLEVNQPTDQTTSRAINAALFISAVKEFQNPKVFTPKTWLLPIDPQTNHAFASDATHVVVQEVYDKNQFTHVFDKNSVADSIERIGRISDEALRQYFDVIIKVGLFDTANNLLVDAAGNLMNVDLEQPNDEPSILERDGELYKQYANQRGHTKTDWDRYEGVKKLYEICSGKPYQKAIIEECIKTSSVMKMVAPKAQELIRGLIVSK